MFCVFKIHYMENTLFVMKIKFLHWILFIIDGTRIAMFFK